MASHPDTFDVPEKTFIMVAAHDMFWVQPPTRYIMAQMKKAMVLRPKFVQFVAHAFASAR